MKSKKETAQKEKELNWLLAFQAKCLDCPRSIPDQPNSPAPDLIFSESGLGVEVIEYLLGQGKDGSHSRRLESIRRGIVREAQLEYQRNVSHRPQVTVNWATASCPTKREEKAISQKLARLVAMQTSGSGRLWRISWEQFDEPTLEKYVAEVSIYLVGGRGQSRWFSGTALWLWEAEPRVKAALDEKEPKASKYRKYCRELWLLIVADKLWLSSKFFPDQNFAKATFRSSFDRAFLLDEASSLVYELRIER